MYPNKYIDMGINYILSYYCVGLFAAPMQNHQRANLRYIRKVSKYLIRGELKTGYTGYKGFTGGKGMYRQIEDDNSIYTQEELRFMCGADRVSVNLLVNYDKGVKFFVLDMQGMFDNSFEGSLDRYHKEHDTEYAYSVDDAEDVEDYEVISIADLTDMVISSGADKKLLCALIDAVTQRLVRVW